MNPQDYPEEEREFNRYTLLGEFDLFFVSLLKERFRLDGTDMAEMPEQFRAHMNRGVVLLQNRVRDLTDLVNLVNSSSKT